MPYTEMKPSLPTPGGLQFTLGHRLLSSKYILAGATEEKQAGRVGNTGRNSSLHLPCLLGRPLLVSNTQ